MDDIRKNFHAIHAVQRFGVVEVKHHAVVGVVLSKQFGQLAFDFLHLFALRHDKAPDKHHLFTAEQRTRHTGVHYVVGSRCIQRVK